MPRFHFSSLTGEMFLTNAQNKNNRSLTAAVYWRRMWTDAALLLRTFRRSIMRYQLPALVGGPSRQRNLAPAQDRRRPARSASVH